MTMKAVARINTQARRFDLRLAASAMDKNSKVAAEVLADESAGDALHHNAKRLIEVTELNLMDAIGAYLRAL
jgi:hypothetical protein